MALGAYCYTERRHQGWAQQITEEESQELIGLAGSRLS
jgi:hypothetical protein